MNSKKKVEAEKKLKTMKKRLNEIEEKSGKINIPGHPKISIKLNAHELFKKIWGTLFKMDQEGAKDHTEVETKQIGNVKVEKGMRIRFLDDKKDK